MRYACSLPPRVVLLLFLLACTPAPDDTVGAVLPPPLPDTAAVQEDTAEDSGPRDTGSAQDIDPVVTEEDAPSFEDADLTGWLFTLDRIHEVALTIPTDSVNALGAAPYEWASADISIDGESLPNVGVRLRGKIGSFRPLSSKPKFKVSFGEYVDDQTFYGLKELSLNNSIVDCSYMKETIAHRIYAMAGMPYLRTAYAHVTVNGADYGLYVLLETPNDVWLERHYADAGGNMYDGKYVWYGGWSYTLLDFGDGVDALYQLEEGQDVANADIAAVSERLVATRGTSTFYDDMGELVDWDEIHRNIAVDQFVGHVDGYSMNTNNYRVYFDPSDGRMDMFAWDLDYAFYRDVDWGMSWQNANGNLTNACFADSRCRAAQRAAVRRLVAAYEAEDMEAWYDEVEALTYAATQSDPRRECAATDVQGYRNYIRDWLRAEPAYLRGWWGL